MAESLCCPPETITTLLIGYAQKVKKNTICIKKSKISIGFRDMAANARKQLKLLKWRVLWASQVVLVVKNLPASG